MVGFGVSMRCDAAWFWVACILCIHANLGKDLEKPNCLSAISKPTNIYYLYKYSQAHDTDSKGVIIFLCVVAHTSVHQMQNITQQQ